MCAFVYKHQTFSRIHTQRTRTNVFSRNLHASHVQRPQLLSFWSVVLLLLFFSDFVLGFMMVLTLKISNNDNLSSSSRQSMTPMCRQYANSMCLCVRNDNLVIVTQKMLFNHWQKCVCDSLNEPIANISWLTFRRRRALLWMRVCASISCVRSVNSEPNGMTNWAVVNLRKTKVSKLIVKSRAHKRSKHTHTHAHNCTVAPIATVARDRTIWYV